MECLFCNIAKGKIPCEKIYEDELILAFRDIKPIAPVHALVIPKEHIASANDVNEQNSQVIGHIFSEIKNIAAMLGIKENGYRVVTNVGAHAGQTVFHIHFHILGGRALSWEA